MDLAGLQQLTEKAFTWHEASAKTENNEEAMK